jgi:multiple sugar transport system substrate-binding protein
MRQHVRLRTVSALLLAGTMALAGCSSGGGESEDGTVTIRYTNFSANAGNEENLQAMVDAFEEANPNIKVETEILPFGDYFTALQTSIAGGTIGDTFELNFENFAAYAGSGALRPLENVPTGVYAPSLLEGFQYDGQQLGLPLSFSAVVLLYNRGLFEAAGIDEPTADWTWEDERDAAQALTDAAGGVFGDMQSASYNEFYKALVQAGGDFLSADGTRAAFNTPAGVKAASWLLEKYGTTMATEAQGLGTPDFDKNLFQDNKLAMWHTGIWMFGPLADIDVDWDVVPEPAGPGGEGNGMFANGVFVSNTSEHPAEAQKWLEFLSSSDEAVQIRLDAAWELPPISSDAKLATYLEQTPPANRGAVIEAMNDGVLPPVIVPGQEVADVIQAELNAARDGSKTVEQALADAEQQVNEILADA